MAATHVVSLFLPYTTHFHDHQQRNSSPPQRPPAGHPPIQAQNNSDIPKRGSVVSLLDDVLSSTSDPSPATAVVLFSDFAQDVQQQLPITPGNPRSLMRSDAHVPDWGKQAVFNQPRSRAGPLPSGSILDFARVHEELQRKCQNKKNRARTATKKPPPRSSLTSRADSSERGFDSKTWTVGTAMQGNASLINAVRDSSSDFQADITWHGTLDFPTDSLSENLRQEIADHLANEYQAQVVFVTDKNFQGHYAGYCKTILWPIFHYQVPDHPKSRAYADHSWRFYSAVNQAFADRVIENYKRGDIIWVHDYHLLLVPKMIRERLPDAQIGFFLHIAFPSSEVFRCLWMRTTLLEGMLGANLIAFQVAEYAEHFLQTCSRILTVETTSQGVQLDDHFVNVISKPIGINLEAVNEQRDTAEVQTWIATISQKYAGKRIIVARDKLDSISGVRHKLLSFELFLNKHPQWRDKIVFIQVATSTNEQAGLMAAVSDIVTRIESAHSTLAHQVLVFLKQDIPFPQYLALLSVADVLVVGSLRDGMNLTAHDYAICQDGKYSDKKYGSLILSEFTGSAALFGDCVLSINPWAYHDQCSAIKQALEMSDAEKKTRWTRLHDIVLTHTGGEWAQSLSGSLRKFHGERAAHDTTSIPRLSQPQVAAAYRETERRVFILDHEGTLAPHRTQTGHPLGSPQRVLDALSDLIQDPRNLVYVMSGRMPDELDTHFKTVPRLGLIAENGCFIRQAGIETRDWVGYPNMDAMHDWKTDVRRILRYYLERMDGSYLEERHCSIILRFEECEDREAAGRMIGECADHINGAFNKLRVHAVPVNQAILIEVLDYGKGFAAEQIMHHLHRDASKKAVDFLFIAGDDREDEGIFRWANNLSDQETIKHVFTVSVGKRNTLAQATLTQGTSGLLTVLVKLAKLSADAQPEDYFNVKERA